MNCAVIDSNTNKVINIVVLGNDGGWQSPYGTYGVILEPNESCELGQEFDAEATPRFFGAPLTVPKTYTAYQFLMRFTPEERASFRAAAIIDPIVADFQQLAGAAQEISTDNPVALSGMAYLVSVGLITESRKQEILG